MLNSFTNMKNKIKNYYLLFIFQYDINHSIKKIIDYDVF